MEVENSTLKTEMWGRSSIWQSDGLQNRRLQVRVLSPLPAVVAVAQLAERLAVTQSVTGSNPISHPCGAVAHAGRAPGLQPGGQGFNSPRLHLLDRMAEGQGDGLQIRFIPVRVGVRSQRATAVHGLSTATPRTVQNTPAKSRGNGE
jgi:hypothetical protein